MGFNFSQQPKTHFTGKFKNEELQNVANEFCLDRQEVVHLYSCFSSFQKTPQAYLTLDDIASSLHDGDNHYSQLPYLQRLFTIISRKAPGKLFFEEYLTGISTFCLMNGEAILHFVFDWLDKDGDGQISREDIAGALAYQNPKTQQKTFLCDFLPDLDNILQSNQQLKFQSFRQMSNKLLFIIWPACELQERLRERNLGAQFWQNLYVKIDKSEQSLRNKVKTTMKTQEKINLLAEMKKNKKARQYITLKQKIAMRIPYQPSTDFQLLETNKPKRRNSSPYIKAKFTSWQFDLLEQKQEFMESSKNTKK